MSGRQVIVVGGGAAGFFAAIACAESSPDTRVTLLERGGRFLDKVRISGGGRCNVTHAPLDPREFAARYPRGGPALLAAFHRWSARDTAEWFQARGVKLRTEADGRVFPVTDTSQTIVDCLLNAARAAGVRLRLNAGVERVERSEPGGFMLTLRGGERVSSGRLLLATGGCRAAAAGQLAISLGHTLEPPVPSLFTFTIESPWLRSLAGVAVESAEISVPATKLRERGPVLVTHWGLSGPAVLRLSAWGARRLHESNYRFPLRVNWLPERNPEGISRELGTRRTTQPARQIANSPPTGLPSRLWEQLVMAAGIPRGARWASLARAQAHALAQQVVRSEFAVAGKSLNREEFVTCGGVRLAEVNFKTMESRVCPGLFFGGELLDIDGVTGGFNFQAAWTTGLIAGRAMAA
jgi:predicted Rossmann fold flavoprotein